MAKNEKKGKPRTLRCVVSNRPIEYCGFGRPPKYHPEVKAQMLKDQREKARKSQKTKKAALRKAA